MNPILAAIMRIAQGHYGGRPPTSWLQRVQQSPESRFPVTQNVIGQLGALTPDEILRMPNH